MAYTQKNNPFKKSRARRIKDLEEKIEVVQGWQDVPEGEWDRKASRGLRKEIKFTRKLNRLKNK